MEQSRLRGKIQKISGGSQRLFYLLGLVKGYRLKAYFWGGELIGVLLWPVDFKICLEPLGKCGGGKCCHVTADLGQTQCPGIMKKCEEKDNWSSRGNLIMEVLKCTTIKPRKWSLKKRHPFPQKNDLSCWCYILGYISRKTAGANISWMSLVQRKEEKKPPVDEQTCTHP